MNLFFEWLNSYSNLKHESSYSIIFLYFIALFGTENDRYYFEAKMYDYINQKSLFEFYLFILHMIR